MRRVAAMPSGPGISRSISTTSAPCSSSAATASSAPAAVATTSTPSKVPMRLARPGAHDAVVVAHQDPDHAGTSTSTTVPAPGDGAHLGVPAQVGRKVLDQGEAEVALVAAARPGGGVEAAAVVADRSRARPSSRVTRTATDEASGVRRHVAQGLAAAR